MSDIKKFIDFYPQEVVNGFFPLTLTTMTERKVKIVESGKRTVYNPFIEGDMYVTKNHHKFISLYDRKI